MYRLISAVIFAVLILHHSTSWCTASQKNARKFEWVRLNTTDPIPANAITINWNHNSYVGRAQHYDELLPAEVFESLNSSYANIISCGQTISKYVFEVLVSTIPCEWKTINSITDVPKNVVRVGNNGENEPIYFGGDGLVTPILLSTNQILRTNRWAQVVALTCDDDNEWVDTASSEVPKNAISGGQSAKGDDIFVARLKKNCNIFAGQVTPKLGIATANDLGDNQISMEAYYCQVLVGDALNFEWVPADDGFIPDYAVVAAKSQQNELMYVARINQTLGYITYSQAFREKLFYEVLVKVV